MHTTQPPIKQSLDYCIKCNICNTACPVMAITDLFPGPKYTAPQAGRFRQAQQPTPDKSVDYCSGCRLCNLVCPTGVKIAEMNSRARATLVDQGAFSPVTRLRNNLLARVDLVGKVGHTFAPISNFSVNHKATRRFAEATIGIAQYAPFPPFSKQRFTTWFDKHSTPSTATRKVVYFHGCSTQYFEPRIGRAAINVLEANGFEVIVPPQNCCGLPLLSNGEFAAARKYHTYNVKQLAEFSRQGIPIVGTSTSCTLTLKEEAPDLLDMHDEETQLVSQNVFDFNEFLLILLEEDTLNLEFNPIPLSLPYHVPCQYRAHRLGSPGLEILDLVPELHVIESQASCCGIAGTYGYKKEKYDIAMMVGQPLFEFVQETNSQIALCDSETCRWQITHGTGVPAVHPAELLAAGYGYEVEGALNKIHR